MNYWWTSDPHYFHSNIIRYCSRPFMKPGDLDPNGNWISKEIAEKRCEWMNTVLIKNHNARVKKGDIVFVLGDFNFNNTKGGKLGEGGLTTATEVEAKLNGKLIHIIGNHTKNNGCKTIILGLLIKFGGKKIWCVHKPQHANLDYSINFIGHIHSLWKFKSIQGKYNPDTDSWDRVDLINVGVDVNNFMPVTFNEIMKSYYMWKRGVLNDLGQKKEKNEPRRFIKRIRKNIC